MTPRFNTHLVEIGQVSLVDVEASSSQAALLDPEVFVHGDKDKVGGVLSVCQIVDRRSRLCSGLEVSTR